MNSVSSCFVSPISRCLKQVVEVVRYLLFSDRKKYPIKRGGMCAGINIKRNVWFKKKYIFFNPCRLFYKYNVNPPLSTPSHARRFSYGIVIDSSLRHNKKKNYQLGYGLQGLCVIERLRRNSFNTTIPLI